MNISYQNNVQLSNVILFHFSKKIFQDKNLLQLSIMYRKACAQAFRYKIPGHMLFCACLRNQYQVDHFFIIAAAILSKRPSTCLSNVASEFVYNIYKTAKISFVTNIRLCGRNRSQTTNISRC